MNKAFYPGTFDPITKGHLDIIKRSSKIYDHVYVAIMINPRKKCVFSAKERKDFIEKCVKDLPNVEVVIGEGLTVDYASSIGCNIIIRGIRAVSDYEYELSAAYANMQYNDSIETVLMISKPELSFLSSSITKEFAYFGADISPYIPEEILEDVKSKLCNR